MAKYIRWAGILIVLAVVLCIDAFAAAPSGNDPGIYDLSVKSTVTLQIMDSQGSRISPSDGFYPNARKISLTYRNGSNASNYLVIVLTDTSGTPTTDNLSYVDQKVVSSSTVEFTIFPRKMVTGQTYYVYVTSNGTGTGDIQQLTQVASFTFYAPYYDIAAEKLDGTMGESGELTWTYQGASKQITLTGSISKSRPILVAGYDESGRMLSLNAITTSGGKASSDKDSYKIKVFWVESTGAPRCQNLTFSDE